MMTYYSKIRLQVSVLRTNGPLVFLLYFHVPVMGGLFAGLSVVLVAFPFG